MQRVERCLDFGNEARVWHCRQQWLLAGHAQCLSKGTLSGYDEYVEALPCRCISDCGERQTMTHLLIMVMPPMARGQTWVFQLLPVSTVPNTGRNQSDSGYRGLDDDDRKERSVC